MRIGIDCRNILNVKKGQVGGISHYIYNLVSNLVQLPTEHEFILFVDKKQDWSKFTQTGRVQIRYIPLAGIKKILPYVHSHVMVGSYLNHQKIDVFHATTPAMPLNYDGRVVTTIHDLAILDHPEWFPSSYGTKQVFSTQVGLPNLMERARFIIAVSRFTAKNIEDKFHVSPRRIRVIPEAVERLNIKLQEARESIKQFNLGKKYLCFIGTIEPRKNISMMIDAYHEFIQRNGAVDELVLIGSSGWNNKEIFDKIKKINLQISRFYNFVGKTQKAKREAIKYLGVVPEEKKWAILKAATCFVWPTLYEGFGMPPLEAMSLGVPVITSNNTSIPEVVGNAAILINSTNQEELIEALFKVLKSQTLQRSLATKGRIQAKKFSWVECAKETLKVYEDAVERV